MIALILRLLLFAAIGILLWRLALYFLRPPDDGEPSEAFERTHRCEGCGTHVPAEQLTGNPPRCTRCRSNPD